MTSLQFQPLIPPALWLALALAAAAALAGYAWRRPAAIARPRWFLVMSLAGAGLALVLAILLNPLWLAPVPPPEGQPLVTILADRSASMAVADQPHGDTRLQTAAALAAELQRGLAGQFDVQVRSFAAGTAAAAAEQLAAAQADGQLTDLAAAVAESLDGERIAEQAIVVLSDGIHNAPGGAASVLAACQRARAMSTPIFAAPIGGSTASDDLELTLARQQELAFIGRHAPIRAQVRQRGRLAAETEVILLDAAGKELERQVVKLDQAGLASAAFAVQQDKVGLHRYQVRTQPLPGEATASNNTCTFLLRAVDRPIRVLLLEGKPYWDAKFLMRTLAHDASLELDAAIRVTDGRFVLRRLHLAEGRRSETSEVLQSLPPALAPAGELAQYQVVVLGRDAEAFLSEAVVERLRTWLGSGGGSLVCFRGAPVAKLNQQLARLMPVRWSPSPEARFRMQLTGRGQDLSWIAAASHEADALARLPSLATAARPERPTPLAVVLASNAPAAGDSQPVVSYQPYGSGRVVAIEGAGMWRWAFLAPEHQAADPIYESLWQGLMRWLVSGGGLAPGQVLALRTEKVSFFSEEPAVATLLVREELLAGGVPQIELNRADGTPAGAFSPASLGDEPGAYRVDFGRLPAGAYEAAVVGGPEGAAESSTAFDVRPNFTEQLDTAARPDLLARMADESGGAVLPQITAREVARRFGQHLAESRPLQVREITLWDRWWVLALVIGLWSAAWGLRRERGLV